jgi:hypothetical protein
MSHSDDGDSFSIVNEYDTGSSSHKRYKIGMIVAEPEIEVPTAVSLISLV